jgi:uncharacterized membrane protein
MFSAKVLRRRTIMTNFLVAFGWMVLYWLVIQVEAGVEDESVQEIEAEPYEPIEQVIKMAIGLVSILLLSLSLSAYKKTHQRTIIYAAIAFGLFALQMLFEYLGETMRAFEGPYNDLLFSAMTLAILVLFFFAIVRRHQDFASQYRAGERLERKRNEPSGI